MQKKYWGLSRYHRTILVGYLLLIILIAFLAPQRLTYSYSPADLWIFVLITCVTVGLALLLNTLFRLVSLTRRPTPFPQILCISLLFALPEEVLFRGILQAEIMSLSRSVWLGILCGTLLFGVAHLPNGATGVHPKKWNWLFAAAATVGGIPLALLFAFTHSLLFPSLLHVLYLIVSQLFSLKSQVKTS